LLLRDPAWAVRSAVLQSLSVPDGTVSLLLAADDPHWRVRHELVQQLLRLELACNFGRLFSLVAGKPHKVDGRQARSGPHRYRATRAARKLLTPV